FGATVYAGLPAARSHLHPLSLSNSSASTAAPGGSAERRPSPRARPARLPDALAIGAVATRSRVGSDSHTSQHLPLGRHSSPSPKWSRICLRLQISVPALNRSIER